jgi:hypothetical protein
VRDHRIALTALTAIFAATAAVSCGKDATPPEVIPGMQFISGHDAFDTAGAYLPGRLIVEVRDSLGAIVPDSTVVRFETLDSDGNPEAFVRSANAGAFKRVTTNKTDASGRAWTQVRLGERAGASRVVVSVSSLGFVDTAHFVVYRGHPVIATIVPSDTALYVGGTFKPSATISDAHGNSYVEKIVLSGTATGLSVSSEGAIQATAQGRFTLSAAVGIFPQSISVSVVPKFKLAAWKRDGATSQLMSMELDGSDQRVLAPITLGTISSISEDGDISIGSRPVWLKGTSTIVYTTIVSGKQLLLKVQDTGGTPTVFLPLPPSMFHQARPSLAPAGAVFFLAVDHRCNSGDPAYCLFQSKSDATSLQLVHAGSLWDHSPGPGGTRIAFTGGGAVVVYNTSTDQVEPWQVSGGSPAWAPNGDHIAFVHNGAIKRMDPNGTNVVTLSPSGTVFGGPLRWSPDSKWIIARTTGNVLAMLNVTTHVVLPLPYSKFLFEGTLR